MTLSPETYLYRQSSKISGKDPPDVGWYLSIHSYRIVLSDVHVVDVRSNLISLTYYPVRRFQTKHPIGKRRITIKYMCKCIFIFTLFIPRIEPLGEVGSDFPYGLPNSGGDPRGSALLRRAWPLHGIKFIDAWGRRRMFRNIHRYSVPLGVVMCLWFIR